MKAQAHIEKLAALGIGLNDIGETLQCEGVRLFAEAYEKFLSGIPHGACQFTCT